MVRFPLNAQSNDDEMISHVRHKESELHTHPEVQVAYPSTREVHVGSTAHWNCIFCPRRNKPSV